MGAYSKNILCKFNTTTTRCIWWGLSFDVGRRASILTYECTFLGCNTINKAILRASKYDSSESIKKRRKFRLGKAKQKDYKNEQKEGKTNEAGTF